MGRARCLAQQPANRGPWKTENHRGPMEEQSNRPSWQMAAVLAAAQSRPADEKEVVLEEEHNHRAAVVLEAAPEEVQSLLLAVCREEVQEGARNPLAVYSAGAAVD